MKERGSKLSNLVVGSLLVGVSGSVAGAFTGAYWHSAGLLIGPGYWGVYLGSLAVALLLGRRWLALGMLVALPIAVPAFFGLVVLSAADSALS